MIASPITECDGNYWDSLHHRVDIADQLVDLLQEASRPESRSSAFYRMLSGPTGTTNSRLPVPTAPGRFAGDNDCSVKSALHGRRDLSGTLVGETSGV